MQPGGFHEVLGQVRGLVHTQGINYAFKAISQLFRPQLQGAVQE